MAYTIRICSVFLFINVSLMEAYSGKRLKRDYDLHDEKSEYQIKDNSLYEENASVYKNTYDHKITMSEHHITNKENENALFDNESNEDMNNNFQKSSIIAPPERKNEDSWTDLVINFSKLAKPYLPGHLSNLNLDWEQVEVALRSLEHFTTSYERGQGRSNLSPIMTTVRAVAAAATPMIMDYVRVVMRMVLDIVDNTAFVTSGHAISRRGLSENILDDVMNAFSSILEHMAADQYGYHDTDGV